METLRKLAHAAPFDGNVEIPVGDLRYLLDAEERLTKVERFAGNVVQMLRQEIEHAPPDKRNRTTVNVMWGEEEWNLTLAKGQYESEMEKQRDAARAERDHWMVRALGPTEQPINNDHEQDGD